MKKQTVALPNRNHQPSKAEMNEKMKVDVPGKNVQEKMDNFASAIMRPATIRYRKK